MSDAVSTPSTSADRVLSVNDLIEVVLRSEKHTWKEKKKLIDEIRKNSPALNDRWLYRWVVWFLGATAILSVVGLVVLLYFNKDLPDGLIALGSASVGALAGLFTSKSQEGDV
jgi:hypothetical protein